MPAPYIPEHDVYNRLPDGRRELIARAGIPIPYNQAVRLGLVKQAVVPGPVEVKEAPAALEAPAPAALEAAVPVATESAAELAAAHGIDLTTVRGTGAGGKIIKSDVESLL